MPIEIWLAFCAASFVLLAIPGPTIMLVITYALGQGRRAAVPIVAGVAIGDFVAMTACKYENSEYPKEASEHQQNERPKELLANCAIAVKTQFAGWG